jgi:UDP-N-acetyl-2-amino-2-deoxyglucuronate dehydrogenase
MKNFALIGAAGYVAPRHMKAIRETGNRLIAALDPFDSVGIIDSYFPDADFFVEFERFDRHIEKLKRQGTKVDYVSVCSPNYLHDAHIRFGLRAGADVICEKPVVLNPWNIDALQEIEAETGRKINTILQLRLHPSVLALKEKIESAPPDKVWDIDLTYLTSRGHWYYTSWKGELKKSGGIATNIGVHFYDMLLWLFGPVKESVVHIHTHDRAAGYLELERRPGEVVPQHQLRRYSGRDQGYRRAHLPLPEDRRRGVRVQRRLHGSAHPQLRGSPSRQGFRHSGNVPGY